jgi:hypothetical protein
MGLHDRHNAQAVQTASPPLAFIDSPCQDRLVSNQANFAVGEAWASVNICTSSFDIVSLDRRAAWDSRHHHQSDPYNRGNIKLPHDVPSFEQIIQIAPR